MDKLKIPYTIIVEGKYDKIKVSSVADAYILTTDGFGVFKNRERLAVIRRLAERSKIIILTDSDGAGKLIRSHITSAIPKDRLIQLYVPQVRGKEKRKREYSAEGFLGVEGTEVQTIRRLLLPYALGEDAEMSDTRRVTKLDMYEDGLTGGNDSAARRDLLSAYLGLPKGMTANALLAALEAICTYDEYKEAVGRSISS